tara:strand:+ start:458 stop:676 length:219 start_codon:yes stop_codon:yes gene_type:complete
MTQEIREYYTKLIDYALGWESESGLCQCDGCTTENEDGHDGLYSGKDIEIFKLGNNKVWVFREDIKYIKGEK